MRRGAKPAKSKVEAKPPIVRKSREIEDSRVHDLEKRLAEALKREAEALEQQTATSEVLRAIAQTQTDAQPVFDTIVRAAARLCDAPVSALFLTDGGMLYHRADHGSSPQALAAQRGRFPRAVEVDTTPGMAILRRTVVHVPDIEEPSAPDFVRQSGRLLGFRAVVAVPIVRDGEPVGALSVTRREAGRFSDAEVALLRTFADQAVIAIENVRLFTELQEKNRELATALDQQTATSEILRAISSSLTDAQPVFNTIVQSGLRLLGGYSATMMLLRDDDRLDLVAYTSTSAEADSSLIDAFPMSLRRIPPGERAIHERRAHAIEDVESAPDATDVMRETGRARGWRSNLFVPMIRDDIALGLISITRREPGPFAADQIALLETFADQAVIAIENVRLFKQLEARNQDLSQMLDRQTATAEILGVISQAQTDVRPVFEAIADSAMRLLGAWATAVTRYDGEQVSLAAARGGLPGSADAARDRLELPHRPTLPPEQPVLTKRVHHIVDVETDPSCSSEFRRHAAERGLRSFVSVPMLRGKDPLGIITVSRAQPGGSLRPRSRCSRRSPTKLSSRSRTCACSPNCRCAPPTSPARSVS
jgi:GAF domain-containing protein